MVARRAMEEVKVVRAVDAETIFGCFGRKDLLVDWIGLTEKWRRITSK